MVMVWQRGWRKGWSRDKLTFSQMENNIFKSNVFGAHTIAKVLRRLLKIKISGKSSGNWDIYLKRNCRIYLII